MSLVVAKQIESAGRGEDRITVVQRAPNRTIIVVADGAGGTAGGAEAADAVCREAPKDRLPGDLWSDQLAMVDRKLGEHPAGESTAIVVDIHDGFVSGASVGDSIAWIVSKDGKIDDLTCNQVRKPLLGHGEACPTDFGPVALSGRLLLATDGLWKYLDRSRIAALCSRGSASEAAESLVAGVRLRSGALQDDVAIVVCELR